MRRPLLPALVLVGLLAAPAAARIKIDRYEPATLPTVRIWVTLLDDTRPVRPETVRGFSVFSDGEIIRGDVDYETAAELKQPMAIGVVVDARYFSRLKAVVEGIEPVLGSAPGKSIGFVVATHDGSARLPPEGFTDKPAALAASLRQVEPGGRAARLYRGVKLALESFPLAPGLEPEPDDGKLPDPPGPKDPPFPNDRVLYLFGDGAIESEIGGKTESDRLRELVHMARRRGVRIMSIGVTDDDAEHLWTLRVLARKTGGTYRRAPSLSDVSAASREAADELLHARYALHVDVPRVRPGDPVNFSVVAKLAMGESEEAREYGAQIGNVMSWWDRLLDKISDTWERWPWWARALVILGVCLVAAIIFLIWAVRKARKARRARKAAADARAKALASRRPCPVCGQLMMPDWPACMFCAQPKEQPKRFRLTGRSGAWAGEALRFDLELITIGAASHCHVQVPDRGVAPEHCGLRDRGAHEFILSDFNTDSGTWVNGERIAQVRLSEGDLIRVGDTEFVFGVEAE